MTAWTDATSVEELIERQLLLDRLLSTEGAGHVVHDLPVRADGRAVALESRPWRLDPLPYVLEPHEFAALEQWIVERMVGCEAVLDDLYGDRRLVIDGVVDPAVLWSTPRYRLAAVRTDHESTGRPNRLTTYSVDVVRDVNGVWHAVADHTDAPAGFGYALLGRAVFDQAQPPASGPGPRQVDPYLGVLRHALAAVSPVDGPRIVVFSGGIDHPSYIEHSYLATQLGFNLVEGADLVVRQRQLFLRTLSGLEPIDVLFRRLEDDRLDPMEVNAIGAVGIPGVLLAERSGTLALANAHGSGVLESPRLAPMVDGAIEALTGKRPALGLRSPAAVPDAVGVDQVIGSAAELVPHVVAGVVADTPIVVRLHAIRTDDGIVVVPFGSGRVITPTDDPRVPTPCVAKDVWVMGDCEPPTLTHRAAEQVDLITSVPTRAADSLYWLGRATERAEVIARAARVALGDMRTGHPSSDCTRVLEAAVASATDVDGAELLEAARVRLVAELGVVLAEAASVREFLSVTAGRVLGAMADVRGALGARTLDTRVIDDALIELSAFAGLWNESVVRGPAWHFGDYARRYERTVAVLESVAAVWPHDTSALVPDEIEHIEAALAAHDSLVAYRRRHRSDVEWDAVIRLLVLDRRNPRSAGASLDRLIADAEVIGWTDGTPGLLAVQSSMASLADHASTLAAIAELHALAGRLTAQRLATPPDPRLLRVRYPTGGES